MCLGCGVDDFDYKFVNFENYHWYVALHWMKDAYTTCVGVVDT